ncbi:MAG TPA: hypothetical protein VKR06_11145 [Ktedonosporobacter sp.]|nr:hypothetical protein [Ktedonosporobacter sp.]
MLKIYRKHLIALFYGLAGFLLLMQFQAPLAYAANNPQISISLPNGGNLAGHPGTRVHVNGSGFPAGPLLLYTTPVGDPAKCASGDANLTPFDNNPRVTVKNNGNVQFNSTWPASAATATTAYYLCAIASDGTGTLSSMSSQPQSFTVAQPVTISVSPNTVQPGGQITITGANWLPPQTVNVNTNIPNTGGQGHANTSTMSDAQGNFSVTLTVPNDAPAGNYSISAVAPNEDTQWMQIKQDNALTIGAGTATPSATVTATPTPTPAATVTATPTINVTPTPTPSNGGGGGINGVTILIFGLGGAGVLLVIIGVIIWAASSGR